MTTCFSWSAVRLTVLTAQNSSASSFHAAAFSALVTLSVSLLSTSGNFSTSSINRAFSDELKFSARRPSVQSANAQHSKTLPNEEA